MSAEIHIESDAHAVELARRADFGGDLTVAETRALVEWLDSRCDADDAYCHSYERCGSNPSPDDCAICYVAAVAFPYDSGESLGIDRRAARGLARLSDRR
jgi:hypothetical protein